MRPFCGRALTKRRWRLKRWGIIAPRLKELKLIDSIIPEPLGGAHRNPEAMAASLKAQLLADLADLDVLSTEDLKNRRYQRLMSYGYA